MQVKLAVVDQIWSGRSLQGSKVKFRDALIYVDTQVKLAIIDKIRPGKIPEIRQKKILLHYCQLQVIIGVKGQIPGRLIHVDMCDYTIKVLVYIQVEIHGSNLLSLIRFGRARYIFCWTKLLQEATFRINYAR